MPKLFGHCLDDDVFKFFCLVSCLDVDMFKFSLSCVMSICRWVQVHSILCHRPGSRGDACVEAAARGRAGGLALACCPQGIGAFVSLCVFVSLFLSICLSVCLFVSTSLTHTHPLCFFSHLSLPSSHNIRSTRSTGSGTLRRGSRPSTASAAPCLTRAHGACVCARRCERVYRILKLFCCCAHQFIFIEYQISICVAACCADTQLGKRHSEAAKRRMRLLVQQGQEES